MASIVVLDAHDEAHYQEQAPTWDAPTVAARRAADAGVPCFWVSACPTLDLLVAADEVHTGGEVRERSGWAPLDVLDLRLEDPRSGLFPQALVTRLRRGAGRVVCVLNRKGRAQLLDCGACREVARCEQCANAVVLDGELLVCRRCGASRPQVCASCGSTALRVLKVGIGRAREQLQALAGSEVGEVSAGSGPLPAAPVLVGTEAVLHRAGELAHAGGVAAVVFLDFDQELLAPRYRAGEQALALLARASRLLGGRSRGGRIVVQTRLPEHPVILAAASGDPGRLAAFEEPLRRDLRLPPFGSLALLSGPGAAELVERLTQAGAVATEGLAGAGLAVGARRVEVVATAPGTWLVRAPGPAALADALAGAGRPAERVRVEVGPPRL
jgi:primosomal protein N' (replication factor Y)